MIHGLLLLALFGSFGTLGLLIAHEFSRRRSLSTEPPLHTGDCIIYRKQKVSPHPGPRAYDIHPAEQGENYSYAVDKFWVVETVLDDGRILARTRTRKQFYLDQRDPNLRKAGLFARLRHGKRFPDRDTD
jgi:hypothetical protein